MKPVCCVKDDEPWVIRQINQLPQKLRQRALTGYEEAFKEAFEKEPISYKKDNAARRAANTRLREYVENVNKSLL